MKSVGPCDRSDALGDSLTDVALGVIMQATLAEGRAFNMATDSQNAGTSPTDAAVTSTQTAKSYVSPDAVTEIGVDGSLSGGDVLPGFQLSLAELFHEADRSGPR